MGKAPRRSLRHSAGREQGAQEEGDASVASASDVAPAAESSKPGTKRSGASVNPSTSNKKRDAPRGPRASALDAINENDNENDQGQGSQDGPAEEETLSTTQGDNDNDPDECESAPEYSQMDSDMCFASYGTDESDGEDNTAQSAVCLDEKGRRDLQQGDIEEVADLIGVNHSTATLLLRSVAWNKEDLLSQYMDDPEKVCTSAGVPGPNAASDKVVHSKEMDPFECQICRGEGPIKVTALACGHVFCDTCWGQYLTMKINEADTQIVCPEQACKLHVSEDVVAALCQPATVDKYRNYVLESFVNESRTTVWCPRADCGLAVVASSSSSKYVTCQQGHSFCIKCKAEAHAPAGCDIVLAWMKKCDDDSETFNWLSANTQDCPKCHSTIEKNGGCNHMTCRKCKFEFCWTCLGNWQDHSDFYTCNRYDPAKVKADEDGKATSRAALERYLFYYHRYMNHDASRKLDIANRDRAAKKMEDIQKREPHRLWGDVQFVGEATESLSSCRLVLKWTYVLAHSLTDDSKEKNLFCFLQEDLEKKTERLSELLESDAEKLLKSEVKSEVQVLASVAAKSRKKLLKGVEDGLAH
mmetsp:Transcript_17885/g.30055  ORF Transcript_17885/g.30055 Transcript_17885/m.30055 type:complete len:586 (+) Transcript_17885:274-2031(+)|eukprot:CAMPEP_0198207088 /NCGR_PEP_ID=MMETSP1445-20131203/10565_1 /TAXON_ID=36898 /ORGANISM="Pyramimonas sp., Strain CCMP2087" /LENGTH=585 /DNA_ID=CAMNT_0043879993 /DNA_START=273 /DNA_END=2030 /DNA_ORIENTATION=-